MTNTTINTSTLRAQPVATITGTDGNTYTLELRPQINLDYGIRYSVFSRETGDDTETSGAWVGGDTYSDDDNELHLTAEHVQAAWASGYECLNAWATGDWELTEIES